MKSKSLRSSRKGQAGFTLVEIAIVLVIIGLLLGGVLKGQELINNAKVKNAANDMNAVVAAYNSYIDRYKAIPGDNGPLTTLTGRAGNWATVTQAGGSDGVITATAAATFTPAATAAVEASAFWQHLRAAGYLAGSPALAGAAALPVNAFNGLTGIVVNASTAATATGMPLGLSVCMSKVPGKSAAQLDVQLDDGNPATGALRGTTAATGAHTVPGTAATVYVETSEFTICRSVS